MLAEGIKRSIEMYMISDIIYKSERFWYNVVGREMYMISYTKVSVYDTMWWARALKGQ